MRKFRTNIGVFLVFMIASWGGIAQPGPSTILRNMLTRADSTHGTVVLAEGIIEPTELIDSFYRIEQYKLAWREHLKVEEFIDIISHAKSEGLNPDDYHFHRINDLAAKQKNEREAAFFDLLLTHAFFTYASHLHAGRVVPEMLYPGKWETNKLQLNMVQLLRTSLAGHSLHPTLENLKPKHAGYKELIAALGRFEKIRAAGGWATIPARGLTIEPGMSDAAISIVRERLALTGQLARKYQPSDELLYDSILIPAVMKFQEQSGLQSDGVIGPGTRIALAYSVDDYIERIKLNLERYRWLPQAFESEYLLVNIPAFVVELHQGDSILMKMRAILGRPERKTPVIDGAIRSVIYNPTWTVPPTILEEDVLPAVRKNRDYLASHHLRVIDKYGVEVDADGLPWSRYTVNNFPYTIRQDPGTFNSLGLIKFEFYNRHTVFLHDTNMRVLFNEPYRALSSGCIRIDKPFELALFLLQGTPWSSSKLQEAIQSGVTGSIGVPRPMPIHIVYLTSFVDDHNQFQLRNDVYGWDKLLLKSLYGSSD